MFTGGQITSTRPDRREARLEELSFVIEERGPTRSSDLDRVDTAS
jgi:hypothetical protein